MKKSLLFLIVTMFIFASCSKDDDIVDKDIKGCMDPGSNNYNQLATIEDGSCEYLGCIDARAINFDENANVDDGSCEIVQEKQNVIVMQFSAAWCGPCGSWGHAHFEGLLDEYPTSAIGISVHPSGSTWPSGPNQGELIDKMFFQKAYNFFMSMPGGKQYPAHYANEVPVMDNGNTLQIYWNNAVTEIEKTLDESPLMNTLIKYDYIDNTTLNVDLYVRSFIEVDNNNYRVALYLIEDEVVHPQAVGNQWVNDYVHKKVLRNIITPNFGTKFTQEEVLNPETNHHLNYEVSIESKQNKYTLVAVIWRMVGDTPVFVNSQKVKVN